MRPEPARPLWYCPPGDPARRPAPWCRSLPCHGHRPTDTQQLVARILATQTGEDWWGLSPAGQAALLREARHTIHLAGPGLGRPR